MKPEYRRTKAAHQPVTPRFDKQVFRANDVAPAAAAPLMVMPSK